MAIKLISAGGNVVDAAVINMYASGVVQRNSLVDLPRSFATGGANGFTLLAPSSASSTRTMVFGVSLDYAQGASDVMVKVIPVLPGMLWEVDCTNNTSTAQVGICHLLTNNTTVANTSYDITTVTGIFLAYAVKGAAADKKLVGEFLRYPTSWYPSQTTTAA